MEVVTLVIAVFGAVTGAASLAWSIASHVLSGTRVKVELRGGWIGGANLMTAPLDGRTITPDRNFVHEPVVAIQVNNVGRLPVSVTGWGVYVGKVKIGQMNDQRNPALPKLLGVGEEATWFIPLSFVVDAARLTPTDASAKVLRGHVLLGTGSDASSNGPKVTAGQLPAIFG